MPRKQTPASAAQTLESEHEDAEEEQWKRTYGASREPPFV